MKAGWTVCQIGDVCKVVNGGTPKSNVSAYWGGDVNWLTPKEMGQMDGRFIAETTRRITSDGLKNSSANIVPPNSIILSTRAPIGHLAINETPMAFNQGCRGLVASSRLDVLFLYHYLYANKEKLNDLGTGTTFKELSSSALKAFQIPLPPLEEQNRIVAILDEAFEGLDRARANAEANLQNARELFAVTLEASLQRAGGVPITLAEMLEKRWITSHLDGNHGSNYPRKEEFVAEGIRYISANCIDGDVIDLSRSKFLTPERADGLRKGVARNRDVIFAHNATVGPVALLTTDEPRIILSTSLTYYRCDESKISPEFLVFEMRSAGFKRQYEAVMEQATRNQVPITMQRTFSHIVPPMDEQLKIAEIGVQIENDARNLERHYNQKLQDLADLRQSLLQKAFAGELT